MAYTYETFTGNGSFTVPTGVTSFDAFCVGGGAGGWEGAGGGGYVRTFTVSCSGGDVWKVYIGQGGLGVSHNAGGNTYIVKGASTLTAPGAVACAGDGKGSAGGCGGGGWGADYGGDGGTNGSNGSAGSGYAGGAGCGYTTTQFATGAGTKYSGGGGGSANFANPPGDGGDAGGGAGGSWTGGTGTAGATNTGGGGGGGGTAGNGGSGIVVFRYTTGAAAAAAVYGLSLFIGG